MSEEKQDNQTTPEPIAVPDKFKNADGSINTDAMAASYVELEKDRSRRVSEIDALKKAQEQAAETLKISEALEAIKANTTPEKEQEKSFDDYMAEKAAIYAEENGVEVDDPSVKIAMRLVSDSVKALESWNKDDRTALEEKHQRELDEIRGLITTDKSERVKSTPEYVANKEQIDELVGAGMDEGKAIQYVLNKVANTSDTSMPPPSTPSGRVTEAPATSDYWANAEEREMFVRAKGEDAVIKMEEAYAKRTRGE
jgi:hypothetical protein